MDSEGDGQRELGGPVKPRSALGAESAPIELEHVSWTSWRARTCPERRYS